MNVLVACRPLPWPEHSGTNIRMAGVVRALSRLGDVDVFSYVDEAGRALHEPPRGEPVARWTLESRPRSSAGRAGRLRWLAAGELPWKLASRDYEPLRERFRAWARPNYDLAWLARAETLVALGDLLDCPVVCDLDDLEDRKLAGHLATTGRRGPRALLDRVEIRRWAALQARVVERADRTLVCSELDRDRLGDPSVAVLPNGYRTPAEPLGRLAVGQPPTVTMVGLLTYAPNVDAARFLTGGVLDHLRREQPGVEVRLVGRHGREVADLAARPGVTLAGAVPRIEDELARADVAAVPVRFGGGTRIKILEAFAHGIPVVSTTVGAEGLDAVDGEHLLLADDAPSFARACARLLTDVDLRDRVRRAARARWEEAFRLETIADRVAGIAGDVLART